jgi:hypothetical protein
MWATVGTQNPTSADISILGLIGSTSVIVRLVEFDIGQNDHSGSNEIVCGLQRFTASGTGTSATPAPLNAALALAAAATAKVNHTVEPTYAGSKIIEIPLHQKSLFRWVAAPGGEPLSQLAADAGWGFTVRSAAYTGLSTLTAHHTEGA